MDYKVDDVVKVVDLTGLGGVALNSVWRVSSIGPHPRHYYISSADGYRIYVSDKNIAPARGFTLTPMRPTPVRPTPPQQQSRNRVLANRSRLPTSRYTAFR